LVECDPHSVLGAMMTSAALGLEPNTIQQQAFLIPYKKRVKRGSQWVDEYDCQFQIGARGFITLFYRAPQILSVDGDAIHDGDIFEHMKGSESFLKYSKALHNRGNLLGAFSHVRLKDGGESACVLPVDEIYKIRARSETYKSLLKRVQDAQDPKDRDREQRKFDETPWVMWEDDMATKSATKKHAKVLPIAASDAALMAAAEIDNRGDTGAFDLRAMQDPSMVRAVVQEGMEPPPPEPSDDNETEVSTETFGARGPGPAPAPAEAPAPTQKADDWQPTPAQLKAIRDREAQEAAAKDATQATPQRRTRPTQGGIE
jgi:phage RecT family recombinase